MTSLTLALPLGHRARRFARNALILGALSVAGLGATTVRMAVEGGRAMAQSDVEFNAGQLRESLLHARRAAGLYFPGLHHVRQADARLDAIAAGAESTQRRDLAIVAWQAIRTTELHRNWIGRNPSDRARQASERLASLLSSDIGGDLGTSQLRSKRTWGVWSATGSSTPMLRVIRGSGLGAVLTGFALIYAGIGREGGSSRKWLIAGSMMSAIGAIAWAICLSFA
jgi:hypothetical protein